MCVHVLQVVNEYALVMPMDSFLVSFIGAA